MAKPERGEYRPIYVALVDGADFTQLSKWARALFYPLKLTLGSIGIGAMPGAIGVLADRSGMTEGEVREAAAELESHGWIRRDGNVWWLVRGLEFEPSLDSSNALHRTHVARAWSQLPNVALRNEFRDYYAAWFGPRETPAKAPAKPIERPAKGPRNTTTTTTTSTTKGDTPVGASAPTNWPAQVAEVLSLVGPVNPGRVGKQLAEFVRTNPHVRAHGTALLVQAARAYAEHANSPSQNPKFLKHPHDFVSKAGYWVDQVRPGGALEELERSA